MLLYIIHGDDLRLRDIDSAAQDLFLSISDYETESEDKENAEEDEPESR